MRLKEKKKKKKEKDPTFKRKNPKCSLLKLGYLVHNFWGAISVYLPGVTLQMFFYSFL